MKFPFYNVSLLFYVCFFVILAKRIKAISIQHVTRIVSLPVNASYFHLCTKNEDDAVLWIKSPGNTLASKRSLLSFKQLKIEDSGLYECLKAENDILDLESVQVRSSLPIQKFFLRVEPSEVYQHLRIRRSSPTTKEISVKVSGKKIILRCSVGGSNGSSGIDVDMTDESQKYSCICSNCNDKPNASRNVNPIGFAPIVTSPKLNIFTKTEETIYLTCDAKAEPMPVFTWYKISEKFNSESMDDLKDTDRIDQSKKHAFLLDFIPQGFQSKLEIKNMSESDFGSYLCVVKNNYGVGIVVINVTESSPEDKKDTKDPSSSAISFKPSIQFLFVIISYYLFNH